MKDSSMFQRQQRFLAQEISDQHDFENHLKASAKAYKVFGDKVLLGDIWAKIRKTKNRIKALVELQKFNKEMLRACYDVENFEKKYVHLEGVM